MPKQRRAEAVWDEKRERWHIKVQRDGERRSFYSSTPGRRGKHEAENASDEWIESRTEKDRRFGDVWAEFLAYEKANTGLANWIKFESIGRLYLLPVVAQKRISSITKLNWQECINAAYKKGLSKRTCTNVRSCIISFCAYCADQRLPIEKYRLSVPQNAPTGTRQIVQPDKMKVLFGDDTITKYGKPVKSFYIYAWRFLVVTGLRRGELCGLRNDDIVNGVVKICRSINSLAIETRGKNDNARRDIVLSRHAREVLELQRDMLCQLGIESEWVFPDKSGNRLDSNKLYKAWFTYSKQHSISTSLHELRHTYVSVVKVDMPIELLKSQLGHSVDMDTTGVYGHEVDGEKVRAAQIADRVFDRILCDVGEKEESPK